MKSSFGEGPGAPVFTADTYYTDNPDAAIYKDRTAAFQARDSPASLNGDRPPEPSNMQRFRVG